MFVNEENTLAKKKRRGKKRQKRANETSSERNLRSKVTNNERVTENVITKYPFLIGLELDKSVRNKISGLLDNVVFGSDSVHTTPICNKFGPDGLLDLWDKEYKDIRHNLNSVLQQLEESQRGKSGSRSKAVPWTSRRDGVLDGFKHKELNVSALDSQPFQKSDRSSLMPISLENAVSKLKNNTNSGLPYFMKKGKVKTFILSDYENILKKEYPCLPFTRTQEMEKTRLVWGYPICDTLNEMLFYPPLLEYQKKLSWRSVLLGPDEVNKRISDLIIKSIFLKQTLISVDFSAYDASINPKLQEKAFDYIKYLFQNKYNKDIDYINYRFTNIQLVTPDGILSGSHGVPSGSVFTNEIDSIVQYIISKSSNCIKGEDTFQIQGDDGVYSLSEDKVDLFLNTFTQYGLNINKSKSVISKSHVIYLQCLYHIDYMKDGYIGGIYPIYRALNRIMYLERYTNFEDYGIDGSDYFSIRTISILENCKFHPLFKEFVYFIAKHDRNHLIPTQSGIDKFIILQMNSISAEGVAGNQFGNDVRGLKSFLTYKIVVSLKF